MDLGLVKRIKIDEDFVDGMELDLRLDTNSYVILTTNTSTVLVRYIDKKVHLLSKKKLNIQGKDAAQSAYIDALVGEAPLTVCLGPAGTGKTLLALSYALETAKKRRIYLSKPTYMIGSSKAFGAVPGTTSEKYAPFLDSYYIVFEKILGPQYRSLIDMMIKKEDLKFVPIEYMRGCTFDESVFILDEAQCLSWYELSSVLTRMGSKTKIIMLGDLNQIDTKLKPEQTGLYQLCNSRAFRSSNLKTTIQLTQQYRSPLTELINNVDQELREK